MKHRAFVIFSITAYILAGLTLLFGRAEWFPDFYELKFMATMAFISALLISLPAYMFSSSDPHKYQAVVEVQAFMAVGLLLNSVGGLGLYKANIFGFHYDKIAHFVTPVLGVIGFTYFWHRWFGLDMLVSLRRTTYAAFAISILWEFLEAWFDWMFGTKTWGVYGQQIARDTALDMVMNTLGILFGRLVILSKIPKSPERPIF